MNPSPRLRGVFSPVITPCTDDPRRSAGMLVRHSRWLLSQDVGLAVFGTNSEANSLSVVERMHFLDALVESGVPGDRMMPGTGCCALDDSVALTRHAVQHGAGGVLMLPPFFYKGVSDDGLFASYAEVIERVADARLRIYLYHIPQVSQVPISLALIERLLQAYPGVIAGIKDSSGDWNNTKAMLERFQPQGFDVFAGSETFLLATMRAGGAGCITATGNVNSGAIARLYRTWQQPDADAQQQALDAVRAAFMIFPMIPALKAAVAHFSGDAGYASVRPPLVRLNPQQNTELLAALQAKAFSMPGL
ncbi:dihydrodipicolinate synthase family protein [Glaciimonas sp. PCH181]|uniref:dihydrodipicolinate synthase family protein n=1 Tax=Glaciimonas sp. PCH181 TaxID=2133943 RepID=UPI000D3D137A|nr:dihydrodipicolinate synthase family protein [Glaciimonas sp. PCH181]PUA19844.1 dihydrodipicolinate synthase family protein [Glaciimonas sp. PCH181]